MKSFKNLRNENAVTLTALVITIIVLIILAAVSVLGVFGENGIFKSAITAKIDTETAAYTEELKAIEIQTRTQQMKASSDFVYLKAFENNVNNHSMFAEAREVELKNDDTILRIVTKEGYIFYISDDEVEGVIPGGIFGETEEPGDLYPGDGGDVPEGATTVTFGYSTKDLTKEDVKVTVSVSPEPTQQIQYRISSGAWRKIDNNEQINMTGCGTIYVRLYNGYTGGAVVSTVVDWIDKVAPRTPTVTYSSTESSIEVTAYSTDVAKTSTTACSGEVQYAFRVTGDGVTKTGWTNYQTSGNFTFGSDYGLVENGVYTIYVKAKDKVGNETKELTVSASTTRVPDATGGNITITADGGTSESSWTKGPVNVTIKNTGSVSGYTLVYSLDGTNYGAVPSDGRIPPISENGTTVYAAFQNNGNAHGTPETLTLNYIDTEAPEVTAEITQVTSSKIGVSVNATDTKDNNGKSGTSGIKTYMYSCDNGVNYVTGNGSTYEFTGLKDGQTYTIKVKVIDKAGNEATTTAKKPDGSTTITTDKIPDLSDENSSVKVKFNKNTDDAYVKVLKVSADITGDVGSYIVQSSVDGGNSWNTYTSGTELEFTKNGTFSIRLYDGTNAGKAVSLDITNVDNIGPEVTLTSKDVDEKSFKVEITGNDKATSEYASSGLQGFYWSYRKASGSYSEETYVEATSSISTITLEGLEAGTKYTVKVYAVDNLNNKGEEKTIEVETEGLPIPDLNPSDKPGGDGTEPIKANMTFTYNPDPKDGITAGPVVVNVEVSAEVQAAMTEAGYKLYYTTDTNSTWTVLPSSGVSFSKNGTIAVRLQADNTGDPKTTGGAATASVDHIDVLAPNAAVTYKIPSYTSDTIYVQAFGNDSNDGKSAVSGIRGICFQHAIETSETASNNALNWSDWSEEQKATDTGSAFYTITGLSAGTKYRIRVKLIDNVGRETISTDTRTVTTVASGSSGTGGGNTDIPENIDDKIVYLYNNSTVTGNWTKDRVLVTLDFNSINTDDYTVRYRTDGVINFASNEGWQTYDYTSSGFYVENNCLIAAQLISKDSGDMGDIYWGKVYWIDKAAPMGFTISATPGVATVTVKGKSEKDLGTDGYDGSGIASYEMAYFAKPEGTISQELVESMWTSDSLKNKQTITSFAADNSAEYTFRDLLPGTEYVFVMRALDRVGNASPTGYTTRAANDIPVLAASDFKYTYLDSEGNEMAADAWTNKPVTLKLEATSDVIKSYLETGCKFVYLVNYNGNQYAEYTEGGVEITQGTEVYVGLKYGNVDPTTGVQIESAKIDTGAPAAYTIVDTDVRKSSKSLTITMPIDKLTDTGSNSYDADFMSGINTSKFKFEILRNSKVEKTSGEEPITSNTWTAEGLATGQTFTFRVTYYDNAGNERTITSGTVSTPWSETTVEGSVEVTAVPQSTGTSPTTEWGNDGATVTMTKASKYADYSIKYTFDEQKAIDNNWDNEYTEPFWVENNTYIYVQLQDADGEGMSYLTILVECIDKDKPYVDYEGDLALIAKQGKDATTRLKFADEGGSGVYGYLLLTSNLGTAGPGDMGRFNGQWVECKTGEVEVKIPKTYTSRVGTQKLYIWLVDNAGNLSATHQVINLTVRETPDGSWDDTKKVNSPQLFGDMVPVRYDANGNTIEVTDMSTWYDYSKGEWANAITVNEDQGIVTGYWVWIPRFAYRIDSGRYTSTAGKISVEFLKDKTDNTSANVKISRTLESNDMAGQTQSQYVVHPSFTASGTESNRTYYNGEWSSEVAGYWVAKFPAGQQSQTKVVTGNKLTTNNGTTSTVTLSSTGKTYSVGLTTDVRSSAQTTSSGTATGTTMAFPVFLPTTYAYNTLQIGDMYSLAQSMTDGSTSAKNMYGLDRDETNSHMMKNSEWGAVAYLSQSQYGLNYSDSNKVEVYINNYSGYVTGLASTAGASTASTNDVNAVAPWYTTAGQKGSSTYNVYGVYDMSGCVWEYVAGYIANANGNLKTYGGLTSYTINKNINGTTANSFIKLVNAGTTARTSTTKGQESVYGQYSTRYSTVYPYNNSSDNYTNNYNVYKNMSRESYGFGDAILETTGWNDDYSYFVQTTGPFFIRGGYCSSTTNAGLFAFSRYTGYAYSDYGFRVVLVAE